MILTLMIIFIPYDDHSKIIWYPTFQKAHFYLYDLDLDPVQRLPLSLLYVVKKKTVAARKC